tara:strand:+ start:242 stop:1030 length:789 start_codon:yes stop_codon:yes gene_type:complete
VEIINAIILGIIQGLTEFLPVSSSGHLEIFKVILNEDALASESLLMTVVLHFATACSTIVIFKKEIASLLKGLLSFEKNESSWFSLKILISMMPAAIAGFLLDTEIEALFNSNLMSVGLMLILTGGLLFLADKAKPTEKKVSIRSSFLIGISQAIAIIPGISRSGATISIAVLLGIDKENAAKFSFLMVVPLILGKVVKDLISGEVLTYNESLLPLFIGFIFAFFTGIIACRWMIKLVKNSQLKYFSIYCFIIGLIAIASTF